MNILALDLGTTTGYALKTSVITSGSLNFQKASFHGAGMKFLYFKRWLTEIKQSGVDAVYYEKVMRHSGTHAAHCYGAFEGILQMWCEQHEIPYEGIPVGTIKKHATGKGNATKDMMVEAAIEKGYEPVDDNESDAIHILLYALEEL